MNGPGESGPELSTVAKFKIDIVTTNDAKGVNEASKGLEQVDKQAEKLEKGSLKNLRDAFQKLSHEVPIFGTAVSALKNPLSALTIAAGYAVFRFREFSQ